MGFNSIRVSALDVFARANYLNLLAFIVGILIFFRLTRGLSWLSRIPVAIVIGIGSAITLRGMIDSQIIAQVKATGLPLTGNMMTVFNNIIIIVAMLTGMGYFIFIKRPTKGILSMPWTVGRYFLFLCFGASFGATLYGRSSVFIDRLWFLLSDWLGILR